MGREEVGMPWDTFLSLGKGWLGYNTSTFVPSGRSVFLGRFSANLVGLKISTHNANTQGGLKANTTHPLPQDLGIYAQD